MLPYIAYMDPMGKMFQKNKLDSPVMIYFRTCLPFIANNHVRFCWNSTSVVPTFSHIFLDYLVMTNIANWKIHEINRRFRSLGTSSVSMGHFYNFSQLETVIFLWFSYGFPMVFPLKPPFSLGIYPSTSFHSSSSSRELP